MSIVIRILGPEDAALVSNAALGVFDHEPDARLTAEFLNDPRHHLVAALDDGRVVGFVSALHYVHPDKPTELWINEVAVAATHRNRGVGNRILRAMLDHARQLGCINAWVLTDKENTPAMRLYGGAGGVAAETPAVMFEFDFSSKPTN